MSTLKVSTISPLGTDATKTITIGSGANGDVAAGVFTNVPAFEAYLSSVQNLTDNTLTKVQCDTEVYDTASAYDNSTNYRFTVPSGEAGKYFVYARLDCDTTVYDMRVAKAHIYKNGSDYVLNHHNGHSTTNLDRLGMNVHAVIDLSVGDYVEAYVLIDAGSSAPQLSTGTKSTMFGAYKIIGA